MKMATSCIAAFSSIEIDRRFGVIIALILDAIITSETSVSFYQTTLPNIPEDSHLLVYISVCMVNFSYCKRPDGVFNCQLPWRRSLCRVLKVTRHEGQRGMQKLQRTCL